MEVSTTEAEDPLLEREEKAGNLVKTENSYSTGSSKQDVPVSNSSDEKTSNREKAETKCKSPSNNGQTNKKTESSQNQVKIKVECIKSPSKETTLTKSSPSKGVEVEERPESKKLKRSDSKDTPKRKKRFYFLFRVKDHNCIATKKDEFKFKCHICNGIYKQKFSLKRHFLRNHINPEYISAADISNCKINVPNFTFAPEALESTTPSGRKRFKFEGAIFLEHNRDHNMPNLYRCHECLSVFFHLESELKKHYLTHPYVDPEENFPCHVCSAVFQRRAAFSKHMFLVHQNKKDSYTCKRCKMVFAQELDLNKHLFTHGCGKKCKYCDKEFCTSANRKRHENLHEGVGRYACMHCKVEFRNSEDLDAHTKKIHAHLCFTCSFCPKQASPRLFTSKLALNLHCYEKHESTVSKKGEIPSLVSKPGNGRQSLSTESICNHCQKKFPNVSAMLKHKNLAHKQALNKHKVAHKKNVLKKQTNIAAKKKAKMANEKKFFQKRNRKNNILFKKRTTYERKAKMAIPARYGSVKERLMTKKEQRLEMHRFYENLSQNIAENLLQNIDGRANQLSIKKISFNDHNNFLEEQVFQSNIPWSSYNFPNGFDVNLALDKRGQELSPKTLEDEECLYATGLEKVSNKQDATVNSLANGTSPNSKIYSSNISVEGFEGSLSANSILKSQMSLEEKKKLLCYDLEIVFVCSVCKAQLKTHQDFEEHSNNNHPNVEVSCIEIEGTKSVPPVVPVDISRQQYSNPDGVLFSYSVPPSISQNCVLKCTKCHCSFQNSCDLHLHLLDCGGCDKLRPKYRKKLNRRKRIKHTMKHRMDLSIKQVPTLSTCEEDIYHRLIPKTKLKYFSMKQQESEMPVSTLHGSPKSIICFFCKGKFETKLLLTEHYAVCTKFNRNRKGKGKKPQPVSSGPTKVTNNNMNEQSNSTYAHPAQTINSNNNHKINPQISTSASVSANPKINTSNSYNAIDLSVKSIKPTITGTVLEKSSRNFKPRAVMKTPIETRQVFEKSETIKTPIEALRESIKRFEAFQTSCLDANALVEKVCEQPLKKPCDSLDVIKKKLPVNLKPTISQLNQKPISEVKIGIVKPICLAQSVVNQSITTPRKVSSLKPNSSSPTVKQKNIVEFKPVCSSPIQKELNSFGPSMPLNASTSKPSQVHSPKIATCTIVTLCKPIVPANNAKHQKLVQKPEDQQIPVQPVSPGKPSSNPIATENKSQNLISKKPCENKTTEHTVQTTSKLNDTNPKQNLPKIKEVVKEIKLAASISPNLKKGTTPMIFIVSSSEVSRNLVKDINVEAKKSVVMGKRVDISSETCDLSNSVSKEVSDKSTDEQVGRRKRKTGQPVKIIKAISIDGKNLSKGDISKVCQENEKLQSLENLTEQSAEAAGPTLIIDDTKVCSSEKEIVTNNEKPVNVNNESKPSSETVSDGQVNVPISIVNIDKGIVDALIKQAESSHKLSQPKSDCIPDKSMNKPISIGKSNEKITEKSSSSECLEYNKVVQINGLNEENSQTKNCVAECSTDCKPDVPVSIIQSKEEFTEELSDIKNPQFSPTHNSHKSLAISIQSIEKPTTQLGNTEDRGSPTLELLISSVTQNIKEFDKPSLLDDEKFALALPIKDNSLNKNTKEKPEINSLNFRVIIPEVETTHTSFKPSEDNSPTQGITIASNSLTKPQTDEIQSNSISNGIHVSKISEKKNVACEQPFSDSSKKTTVNKSGNQRESSVAKTHAEVITNLIPCELQTTKDQLPNHELLAGKKINDNDHHSQLNMHQVVHSKPLDQSLPVKELVLDPTDKPVENLKAEKPNHDSWEEIFDAVIKAGPRRGRPPKQAIGKLKKSTNIPSKKSSSPKQIKKLIKEVTPEETTPDEGIKLTATTPTSNTGSPPSSPKTKNPAQIQEILHNECKSPNMEVTTEFGKKLASRMKEKMRLSIQNGASGNCGENLKFVQEENKKTYSAAAPSQDIPEVNCNGSVSTPGISANPNSLTDSVLLSENDAEQEIKVKKEIRESETSKKHTCPFCFLEFAYLTNYRRHLKLCQNRPEKFTFPFEQLPSTNASSQFLHLPKRDEVEESMLNLLRHQSRQNQMIKETQAAKPSEPEKNFQKFSCESCHKIYFSLFKLMQHKMKEHLMSHGESKEMELDYQSGTEIDEDSRGSVAKEFVESKDIQKHADKNESFALFSEASESVAEPKLSDFMENDNHLESSDKTSIKISEINENPFSPQNEPPNEKTTDKTQINQPDSTQGAEVAKKIKQKKKFSNEKVSFVPNKYKELLHPIVSVLPSFGQGRGRKKKNKKKEIVQKVSKKDSENKVSKEKPEQTIDERSENENTEIGLGGCKVKSSEENSKVAPLSADPPESPNDKDLIVSPPGETNKKQKNVKEKEDGKQAEVLKTKFGKPKYIQKAKLGRGKYIRNKIKSTLSKPISKAKKRLLKKTVTSEIATVETTPISRKRGPKPKSGKLPIKTEILESPLSISAITAELNAELDSLMSIRTDLESTSTDTDLSSNETSTKTILGSTAGDCIPKRGRKRSAAIVPGKGRAIKLKRRGRTPKAGINNGIGKISEDVNFEVIDLIDETESKSSTSSKTSPGRSAKGNKSLNIQQLKSKKSAIKNIPSTRKPDSAAKPMKAKPTSTDKTVAKTSHTSLVFSSEKGKVSKGVDNPQNRQSTSSDKPRKSPGFKRALNPDSSFEDSVDFQPIRFGKKRLNKLCPICKKKFPGSLLRNRHVQLVHGRTNFRNDGDLSPTAAVRAEKRQKKLDAVKSREGVQRNCVKPLPPLKRTYTKPYEKMSMPKKQRL